MGLWHKLVASLLPIIPRPIVGYFARPYIAGVELADAVRVTRALAAEGACATIDFLGETVTRREQAVAAVDAYLALLDAIHGAQLDASVSLKPTQMGLNLDPALCHENIRRLAIEARSRGRSLCIDMEHAGCTDATLEIFRRLRPELDNVGTVLQARLRRTLGDVDALLPLRPEIRICKGIYLEPYDRAYEDPAIIRRSYVVALEKLLVAGCYVGIATHDETLVFEALRLVDQLRLSPSQYEFQMLLGVRPALRRILLRDGHRVRVYVPYGPDGLAYSLRRLRENPALVGHVLRQTWARLRGG